MRILEYLGLESVAARPAPPRAPPQLELWWEGARGEDRRARWARGAGKFCLEGVGWACGGGRTGWSPATGRGGKGPAGGFVRSDARGGGRRGASRRPSGSLILLAEGARRRLAGGLQGVLPRSASGGLHLGVPPHVGRGPCGAVLTRFTGKLEGSLFPFARHHAQARPGLRQPCCAVTSSSGRKSCVETPRISLGEPWRGQPAGGGKARG